MSEVMGADKCLIHVYLTTMSPCSWDAPAVLVQASAHVFDVVPTGPAAEGWAAGKGLGCIFAPLDDAGVVAYPVGAWTTWLQVRVRPQGAKKSNIRSFRAGVCRTRPT